MLLPKEDKMKYGKVLFQVFDASWEGDFIFIPFDCYQNDLLIIFYLNNDFGNWFFKALDGEYLN